MLCYVVLDLTANINPRSMGTQKLFAPLTRINNNTRGTMLCTKRYSRIITGSLWVKKISPGGHLYVKYRESCKIGKEYWLHNEGRDYAEGERVSFSEVFDSAELDIEPSSSAGPLGFNLVKRTGPMPGRFLLCRFGRFLMCRFASSCGMSCFADPVAKPAPNAANSGQLASTTVVAPAEVQSMVNPGEDQDQGRDEDEGDTLVPSAQVVAPAVAGVPLVVDPGQAQAVAMPGHSSGQPLTPPQPIVIPSEDHDPSPTPLHTPQTEDVNNINGTDAKQGHNANLASVDLHPAVDEVNMIAKCGYF